MMAYSCTVGNLWRHSKRITKAQPRGPALSPGGRRRAAMGVWRNVHILPRRGHGACSTPTMAYTNLGLRQQFRRPTRDHDANIVVVQQNLVKLDFLAALRRKLAATTHMNVGWVKRASCHFRYARCGYTWEHVTTSSKKRLA